MWIFDKIFKKKRTKNDNIPVNENKVKSEKDRAFEIEKKKKTEKRKLKNLKNL